MTILQVVKDVCAVVGVSQPNSLFAGLNSIRTLQEMLALANEMAQRIAYDTREWSVLKLTQTYVGDGLTEAFDVPANFKRMLLTTNMWRSTSALQPMRYVPDTDEWLNRRALGWTDAWGEWSNFGGQIHIAPVMGAGAPTWVNNFHYIVGAIAVDAVDRTYWKSAIDHTSAAAGTFAADRLAHSTYWVPSPITAYYTYLDRNCVNLAAGGVGDRFVADGDSYRLDERLLKLGMIWAWKSQKGSPYAEDMGTYSDAMALAMGTDAPAPIIIGRRPAALAARVAYPWTVPTT